MPSFRGFVIAWGLEIRVAIQLSKNATENATEIATQNAPEHVIITITRYEPNRPAAAIGGGDFFVWTLLVASEAAMAFVIEELFRF